jgi:hypothetical protein
MDETPGPDRAKRRGRRFSARGWAIGMLVTLFAQFGLGMFTNLFIQIPSTHPGAGEHNYFAATARGVAWLETSKDAPVVVATHAGVGLTLVIGSLWMLTRAFRTRSKAAVLWSAILGALCILAAAVNGLSFLDYNNNVNSYLMAMFFAGSVVCYGVILALAAGEQPAAGVSRGLGEVSRTEPAQDVNDQGTA